MEINKAEPSSIHTFPFGPELQFYILGTFLHGAEGPEAPASKIKIGVQSGAPGKDSVFLTFHMKRRGRDQLSLRRSLMVFY